MDKGAQQRSRATSGIVVVLASFTVACGPASRSDDVPPSTVAPSESVAEAKAMRAAEATLRGFFAVKGRAKASISVLIDEQSVYLTSREVHPTVPYEAGMKDRPSLITDSVTSVDLSNARWAGDEIRIDFEFERRGVSYPMIGGDEMQLDAGLSAEGHWDGTATLVDRNGEWLIDDLTVAATGGSIS